MGGDFHDFLPTGTGARGLVLADVSGKGVSAALLMANLQAILRSAGARALGDLAHRGRREPLFFASTAPEHYATLFFAVYDDRGRRLRYANCGHVPPVVLGPRAESRLLPTGPGLGLLEEWDGEEAEVALAPGDRMVAFSDGLTEATGRDGEEFGEARLLERLREHAALSASELAAALVAEVVAFRGGAHGDDVTVVAARAR